MTVGEKILYLRNASKLSKDTLSKKLEVTIEDVTNWEIGCAIPTIEMMIRICDVFNITLDEFFGKENTRSLPKKTKENRSNKYFGTDGFRGEVNVELTSEHAYKVGRFLGWYYGRSKSHTAIRARILIGKDTRRSSYMLEYSIAAGIMASGADAYMLHVTTTPSVSYITRLDDFECGIMITASHNPYFDNGIKIINKFGEKLEEGVVTKIESYLDDDLDGLGVKGQDLPLAFKSNIGKIVDYAVGRNRYIGYLTSLASHSFKNLRIGLDCANGASWSIAKEVFDTLGAQTYTIGTEPNGLNINDGAGSAHIDQLINYVKENKLDIGFAFDGDADRCIAVDEHGNVIDGDKIIYILANRLKEKNNLHKDTVAITVMSNIGLVKALEAKDIKCELTAVGDRFVYQKMHDGGYSLGGEQSGHIIIRKHATTGDGILTAIMLLEEIEDKKCKISQLCEDVFIFPQLTTSIKVKNKTAILNDAKIIEALDFIENKLQGNGRVILRASGTEPVIRIMIESTSQDNCKKYMDYLQNIILKRGL